MNKSIYIYIYIYIYMCVCVAAPLPKTNSCFHGVTVCGPS